MSVPGRSKAELMAADLVQILEMMHDAEPNPIYAWQAWSFARDHGELPPEWVCEYLDRVSESLRALAYEHAQADELLVVLLELGEVGYEARWLGYGCVRHGDDVVRFLSQRSPAACADAAPQLRVCDCSPGDIMKMGGAPWRWTGAGECPHTLDPPDLPP